MAPTDAHPAPARIALAGCGAIATGVHLRNLIAMTDVRVTALADPDADARDRALRLAPGATTVESWRELLERDDVDAVLVALPAALQAAVGAAVLRAGKHLYLEKPVATSLDDANTLVQAAHDAGTVAMVGFNYRFNPLFRDLAAMLSAGRIGDLVAVRSMFSTNGVAGWRAEAGGGGVLLDLASHHVDLITHLTGLRVAHVQATVSAVLREGDTAALTLGLENGVIAQSTFSFAGPETDTVELIGRDGTATVRRYRATAVELRGGRAGDARRDQLRHLARSLSNVSYLGRKARSPGHEPSYRVALDRFVRATRVGGTATPGIEDGIRAVAVIDAAMRSAASGSRVRVDGGFARAPSDEVSPD